MARKAQTDEEKAHAAVYGRRLRRLRMALGYQKLRRFAQVTDVHEDTLGAWERGTRMVPPWYISKLRHIFGVTHDYLYFGDTAGLRHDLAIKLIGQDDEDDEEGGLPERG